MRIEYSDVICLDKMPIEWAARKMAKEGFYKEFERVGVLHTVVFGLKVYAVTMGIGSPGEYAEGMVFDLLWELESRRVERERMVFDLVKDVEIGSMEDNWDVN